MFEFVEAPFDAVALFVEFSIIVPLQLAIAFRWDHGFCAETFRLRHQAVGIVAAVGKYGFCRAVAQQFGRGCVFAGLPGGDAKFQR